MYKLQHDPHKTSSAALDRNAVNPAVARLVMLTFCVGSLVEDVLLEESVNLNTPRLFYWDLYVGLEKPLRYEHHL